MITDDMLRSAAAKANDALLSTLPLPKDCEHVFSKRFERKMRKLIRHTKYPVVYNILKTAACFLLVSILAAAMFLTSNVKAREAFFEWVKEQYEYFIEYYFDGMVSKDTIESNKMEEYRLGWVPEGYVESEVYLTSSSATIIYVNNADDLIQFKYSFNPINTNLFLATDEIYSYSNVLINNIYTDIYISTHTSKPNIIIWSNEENTILFTISSILPKDDLIKMTNNIIIN